MDVITFFEDLSKKWNQEHKCDSCWTFSAPLSLAGMNATVQESDTVCCNHMFITEYGTSSSYTKNDSTGQINRSWCDHIFTLFVVKKSNLGYNVYNEQVGHPIEESLWKTKLKQLQECLGCGNELDLCELGYEFEIFRWKMDTVIYKEDANYTGWKIMGIFRKYTQ